PPDRPRVREPRRRTARRGGRRELRSGVLPRARGHRAPVPRPARGHREVVRPHPLPEPGELRHSPAPVRRSGRLRHHRPGRPRDVRRPARPASHGRAIRNGHQPRPRHTPTSRPVRTPGRHGPSRRPHPPRPPHLKRHTKPRPARVRPAHASPATPRPPASCTRATPAHPHLARATHPVPPNPRPTRASPPAPAVPPNPAPHPRQPNRTSSTHAHVTIFGLMPGAPSGAPDYCGRLPRAGELRARVVPVVGRLPGLAARRLCLECGVRLPG